MLLFLLLEEDGSVDPLVTPSFVFRPRVDGLLNDCGGNEESYDLMSDFED